MPWTELIPGTSTRWSGLDKFCTAPPPPQFFVKYYTHRIFGFAMLECRGRRQWHAVMYAIWTEYTHFKSRSFYHCGRKPVNHLDGRISSAKQTPIRLIPLKVAACKLITKGKMNNITNTMCLQNTYTSGGQQTRECTQLSATSKIYLLFKVAHT